MRTWCWSAHFSLLIAFLVFFAIKYRRKNDSIPKPADEHSIGFSKSSGPSFLTLADHVRVGCQHILHGIAAAGGRDGSFVGKQWMWKVQHNEGAREIGCP